MMVLRSILFFFMTIGLGCGFCNPVYSQVQNNNSITIWIIYDKNATRAIDKVIRLYKSQGNEINIRYRIIPWEKAYDIFEGKTSFELEISESGNSPDIIQVPSTWSAHLIQQGFLHDLSNEDWINRDLYSQLVWSTCEKNSQLYAIPWFIDVRVLYYRKDILNLLGLNQNNLNSWNSLKSAANMIQKSEIQLGTKIVPSTGEKVFVPASDGNKALKPLGISARMDKGWNVIHNVIGPHYWARTGGREFPLFINHKGGIGISTELESDIAFYCGLVESFTPTSDMYVSFEEIQDSFLRGMYAMHFSGPFLISELRGRWGDEWDEYFGIAQVPGVKSGHYTFAGGSHMGIYRDSTSIGEALRFVEFLATNEDAQKEYSSIISQIPALRNLQNSLGYHTNFFHVPTWKAYPSDPGWFRVERMLPTEITNWFAYGKIGYRLKCIMGFFVKDIVLPLCGIIVIAIIGFCVGELLRELIGRCRPYRRYRQYRERHRSDPSDTKNKLAK